MVKKYYSTVPAANKPPDKTRKCLKCDIVFKPTRTHWFTCGSCWSDNKKSGGLDTLSVNSRAIVQKGRG